MPIAPDRPSLLPWAPRHPIDHRRLNALQGAVVTDIQVGPGLQVVRKGNSVSISLATDPPRPRTFFKVVITDATVVGGLYECLVYAPRAGGRVLDMAAGPVPTSYYYDAETGYLGNSGNPTSSTTWYAMNNAESNAEQWTLLGNTRGPFMAVDSGNVASDGTRILDLVSEFAPSPCSSALLMGEINDV